MKFEKHAKMYKEEVKKNPDKKHGMVIGGDSLTVIEKDPDLK